ncbi:MAG: hypothetical protein M3Q03_18200 [Chloroflexota bacterium]|nr:hypothetical protein [Chloroflexota bacterium]
MPVLIPSAAQSSIPSPDPALTATRPALQTNQFAHCDSAALKSYRARYEALVAELETDSSWCPNPEGLRNYALAILDEITMREVER